MRLAHLRLHAIAQHLAIAAAGIPLLSATQPCFAQAAQQNKEFDFIVELKSQKIKDYLKFPESGLGNFYKISSTVSDAEGKKSTPYEDLYVCSKIGDSPKLLGCKRLAVLEPKKKTVAMKLKFSEEKGAPEEEIAASSYVVPPLLVELILNENFAGCVMVPVAAYDVFKQALTQQGFSSAQAAASTGSAQIQLRSDPAARSDSLYYSPAVKK